jgi:hypothetical protein
LSEANQSEDTKMSIEMQSPEALSPRQRRSCEAILKMHRAGTMASDFATSVRRLLLIVLFAIVVSVIGAVYKMSAVLVWCFAFDTGVLVALLGITWFFKWLLPVFEKIVDWKRFEDLVAGESIAT